MKPMILAFVAIAAVSVIAYYALDQAGFSAQDQGSSPAVRLD